MEIYIIDVWLSKLNYGWVEEIKVTYVSYKYYTEEYIK